ncbi:hypothetical protein GCM10007977_100170 [Dactylosporangium sucinum]|uniref:Uncharacterized protein n=1 Tax=Dactylosporangium sucinum TaxID=1424081 RepID=A0A917UCQ2_9ACTN|nr:hypothetical protein GCM10007977_100170 [Dactylosporangium sucinum]
MDQAAIHAGLVRHILQVQARQDALSREELQGGPHESSLGALPTPLPTVRIVLVVRPCFRHATMLA